MSSLRLGLPHWLVVALLAVGCSFDRGGAGPNATGAGGSGGSGGGTKPGTPDASAVVDILSGRDGATPNPSQADAGGTDSAVAVEGDSGTSLPGDAGSDLCGNGRLDGAEICDPGLDACCKDSCDGPIAKGHVCRPAEGECDLPEACNGRDVACPRDRLVDHGVVCRPAAGECDEPEACSGEDVDCPDDELVADGTECREAAGECDLPELCDGEDADCPSDLLAADGTECREAKGQCDVAELCNGEDADCPSDALVPLGTPCRESTAPCDAEETCDGVSVDCPSDLPAASSVTCRPAVDACDGAESCTGSSMACPPDLPNHCAVSILTGTLPLHVNGTTAGTCATYVPTCAATGMNANERMYVYTAPEAGTYRFDTFGSAYDTVLAIRDGTSCPATELACSDDLSASNHASMLEVSLTAGQRVLVMVDGYAGASGSFTLTIRDAADSDGWSCDPSRFDRDDGCDCGCGIVDPDCDDATSDACDRCAGCMDMTAPCAGSAKVNASDNSQCTGWLCASQYYGSGDGCDCGCGIVDPDCVNGSRQWCTFCTACGDPHLPCANSASVASGDNSQCTSTWTCNPAYYGSGDGCDCGCGIVDPDCEGITSGACMYCDACDDAATPCAGSSKIDPNDNARCAATPVWTCDPAWYGVDDGCDCGCGIVDPDCDSASASECIYCDSCRDTVSPCGDSPGVVPDDNSRCR